MNLHSRKVFNKGKADSKLQSNILSAVLAGLFFGVLIEVLQKINTVIITKLEVSVSFTPLPFDVDVFNLGNTVYWYPFLLGIAVVSAVVEELIRAGIYWSMRVKLPAWAANVIQAAMYTLLHYFGVFAHGILVMAPMLMVVSLVYGIVLEKYRLTGTITAHVFINVLALGFFVLPSFVSAAILARIYYGILIAIVISYFMHHRMLTHSSS